MPVRKQRQDPTLSHESIQEKIAEDFLGIETHEARIHNQHLTPRFQYLFRLFINTLAIYVMFSVSMATEAKPGLGVAILSGVLFTYTLLGFWLESANSDFKLMISRWLPMVDGFLLLFCLAAINYPLWPTFLLLGTSQMVALLLGGLDRWVRTNLGLIFGLVFGFLMLSEQTIDSGDYPLLNMSLLVMILCYTCLQAYYSHRHLQFLGKKNLELKMESEQRRQYAYKLSRYLPHTVTNSLLTGESLQVQTERKRITVFFSDLVGFTDLSEELESETLAELLNHYLSEMSKIANQYGGTVDKFMGDAIMVLFGDDDETSQGIKRDAVRCVSMSLAMKKRLNELQPYWSEIGCKKPLQIRMGINTGYCTVGTFGTSKNLDYTALGAHVNLASRLESAGQPGNILVSHETWALVKDVVLCRDRGKINAKGFTSQIQVYEVMGMRKEMGSQKSYLSESMEGFSMHLDLGKIKNYDKTRVLGHLEKAIDKLRDKPIL